MCFLVFVLAGEVGGWGGGWGELWGWVGGWGVGGVISNSLDL